MNKVYHGFSHCSGVYKITNIENGDVYFGQAAQLGTRAQQHEGTLVKNKHKNQHLQAAWNKYKSDAFEFEVIAAYPDKTERDAAEQALIDENYGPGCYNIMKKVRPDPTTWSYTPEESSAKRSAVLKGQKRTPEQCKRISDAKKGKPQTQEHRDALGAVRKGRIVSPDTCAALSVAVSAVWAKRRAAKALSP